MTDLTELVTTIAERMRDPAKVNEILFHPDNRNSDPLFPERLNPAFTDYRLLEEYPGLLILLGELDSLFPNDGWDAAVHLYVLKLKEIIEAKGLSFPSFFGGASGIAFALFKASEVRGRYKKMIASLNAHILRCTEEQFLIPFDENLNKHQPSPFSLYDAIQGIVGIGVYCLERKEEPDLLELLHHIIKRLIRLTDPIESEHRKVPGWFLPNDLQVTQEDLKKFPKGSFNLGVAHGIPGVLAFLSLALLNGIEQPEQRNAITCIADWIKGHRHEHQEHLFWGTHISFEEEFEIPRSKRCLSTRRSAWCYGTTGVARSLYLAGKAIKDPELKSYAMDSFCSIFQQTRQEWNLPSPTFCHGLTGLLMTTWMMLQDEPSIFLEEKVRLLREFLLESYREAYPFGFKNLEPCRKGGCSEVSQLSLIEGASGILLTLLTLNGSPSHWHAPFLIGEKRS